MEFDVVDTGLEESSTYPEGEALRMKGFRL